MYEFGSFRLDPVERLLLQRGQSVNLSPQLFNLLVFFVENAGHLLSKEELREKIWGKSFVSDNALKVIVGKLRKTLGDTQNGTSYIDNIRGGGYRFVAEVKRIEDHSMPEHEIDATSSAHGNCDIQLARSEPLRGSQSQISRLAVRLWTWPVIVGVVSFLALACIFAFSVMPVPQLRVSRYVPLTSNAQDKGGPLFTDGARVYFTQTGPDGNTLFSIAVDGGGTGPLSSSLGTPYVFDLAPRRSEFLSGRNISGEVGSELWVMPMLGGSPRRIGDLHATTASWSLDGRQIVFAQRKNLYVSNADGSQARKIAEILGDIMYPHWSPDGSMIRFTENKYVNGDVWQSIWEVAPDGSNLHRLLNGWSQPPRECCGTWTPDGQFFIFEAMRQGRNDLWVLSERRELFSKLFKKDSKSPVLLSSGLQGFLSPIVSIDGKEVFAVGIEKHGELVRYDVKLREFVPFLGGISATWISFSKSGRWVAYINYPDQTLWRANSDGSEKTQLTFSPLEVDGLSWSPNEKWFALRARNPGENWMIHLVPSQGGEVKLIVPIETEQGVPTWSPDGRCIAFGDVPSSFGHSSGTEAIHLLDLNTHTVSELPRSSGLWTARWSPDGKSLAALTIEQGQLKIYDFTTKKWRLTNAKHVNNPNWSHDGKYIYFDTDGQDRALRRVRVADGQVDQLTSLHAYPNLAWWWSGLAPDDSPLILRNLGTNEIYSLALETR